MLSESEKEALRAKGHSLETIRAVELDLALIGPPPGSKLSSAKLWETRTKLQKIRQELLTERYWDVRLVNDTIIDAINLLGDMASDTYFEEENRAYFGKRDARNRQQASAANLRSDQAGSILQTVGTEDTKDGVRTGERWFDSSSWTG